jgi:hypothetical protein
MTLSLLALWFVTRQRRRLGGETPALTPPQVRQIFSALLRDPPPEPEQIAEQVNQVLRRNEESRIYAWHHTTKEYPPRRMVPVRAAGPPRKKRLQ